MSRLKMLLLCSQGNNRSVMMGCLCKNYGWDALAAGVDANEPSTIKMLCIWADYIWVAQDHMIEKLEEEYRPKVVGFPIGDDIWGFGPHLGLQERAKDDIFPWVAHEVRRRVDEAKALEKPTEEKTSDTQ